MAGFFQQLRLLLWKNGLGVIRQPGWTVALLVWPLVIFIILAITRSQFPPQARKTCYVAPRNLPSAGFFPFLQTLMCNTDSSCHSQSRLFTKSVNRTRRSTWTKHDAKRISLLPPGISLLNVGMGGSVRSMLEETADEPQIMDLWDKFLNASHQGRLKNMSLMEGFNNTLLGHKENLDAILGSVNMLKRSFCSFLLMDLNTTYVSDPLNYGLATFCKSNDTLLEVSLLTINQVLTEMFIKDPAQVLTTVGTAVVVFERLQSETLLWEGLLSLPRLLMTDDNTLDQVLGEGESLLDTINRTLSALETRFPEANLSTISMVNPAIDGGINLLQYIRNWHGKDVYITLDDVITLPPNASSPDVAMVTSLKQVRIPLDQAVSLTMDKALLHSYVCSGNISAGLQEACNGELEHILGWVSLDKVAQQTLLAWSKYAAQDDVAFSRGLIHSLTGLLVVPDDQAPPSNNRFQRSSDSQPQTIMEELFLSVGSLAAELLKSLPGWDYVQLGLTAGHATMQLGTTGLDTLAEMLGKVSTDAHTFQDTFTYLMSNQAMADNFTGQVVNSVVKTIMKVLMAQRQVGCEDLLEEWSWFSSLSSMDPKLWNILFCSSNNSPLQDALLAEWSPVIVKATELINIVQGNNTANITLPMILAEWHALTASFASAEEALANLTHLKDADYWMGWVPMDINAVNWTQILMKRGLDVFITMGSQLQNSPLWPSVESYFHIANWIMNYQSNITAPPNCTIDPNTYGPVCKTGFTWTTFVSTSAALMQEFSANPASLLKHVQGSLSFLEAFYGNNATGNVTQLLSSGLVSTDGSVPALLENLITNLNRKYALISNVTSLEEFSTNHQLPFSFLGEMLEALGLNPLNGLWIQGDGAQALNATSVMTIALEVARNTQHLVTGLPIDNSNTPDLARLEALLMQWLSVAQGNLTHPLSFRMGDTQDTYSGSLNASSLVFLKQLLHPLTNQTSAGFTDNILQAMDKLKTLLDAPDGDPTPILLGYVIQLKELMVSTLHLHRYEQLLPPNGNLTTAQVTELHLVVLDLFQLLSNSSIQQLSQAERQATLQVLLQRLAALLPQQLQPQYLEMVRHFQAVTESWVSCTGAGHNCTAEVPQVFQIFIGAVEALITANGDYVFNGGPANTSMPSQDSINVTVNLLALLFAWRDADISHNMSAMPESVLKIMPQTAHFLQQIIFTPNISVSSIRQAMLQSNLTLGELEKIATLARATNAPSHLASVLRVINVQTCLEPQPNKPFSPAQCAMELSQSITSFILALPLPPGSQSNYTALICLLPILVNHSVSIDLPAGSGPSPLLISTEAITITINSIRKNVQHLNLSSVELISNELHVLEMLIQLAATEHSPVYTLNSTYPLMQDLFNAQTVYLEIAQWYLIKLKNVTGYSTFSKLLEPFFQMAEMQLSLQLSQAEITTLISKEVEHLIRCIQYPINGTELSTIGQSVTRIVKENLELLKLNIAYQVTMGNQNQTLINEVDAMISNELPVFEGLVQLATSEQSPVYSLNSTDPLMLDPINAQKVYLEMAQWYLKGLQNVTSNSTFSKRLAPIFQMADIQLSLQISQAEMTTLISNEVENLIRSIQHPINGTEISRIGQSVTRIVKENLKLLKLNIAYQVTMGNQNQTLINEVDAMISNELPVLEGLVQLATSEQSPVYSLNSTDPLMLDPINAQRVYLEMAQWYLRELQNVTSNSTLSKLLAPIFQMADIQLSLQISQAEMTTLISKEVENLIRSIQYPINGTEISRIGQSVTRIVKENLELLKLNIAYQVTMGNQNQTLINEVDAMISNELPVLEGLVQLATSEQSPVYSLNSTDPLMLDPINAQKVYLEMAQWYLKGLQNVTSNSTFSKLLNPFFRMAEMQLDLQLFETEFTIFVTKEVGDFMRSMPYSINETDIIQISQSIIMTLNDNLDVLKCNFAYHKVLQNSFEQLNWLNSSFLSELENQVRSYLNMTEDWLRDPNRTQVITNMLYWNTSGWGMNVTTLGMDFQQLFQTLGYFLSPEQQAYLTTIQQNSQVLNQVLLVASHNGGLSSDQFIQAIMDAASIVLNSFTMGLEPENVTAEILGILRGALHLALRPEMSYVQSLNITMEIIRTAENMVRRLVPQKAAGFLLPVFRFTRTYLENVLTPGGPDKWNEIIVNELKMVQGLLTPNSSSQDDLSVIMNIAHFILDSSQSQGSNLGHWNNRSIWRNTRPQSNMSLWTNMGNDMTTENLAEIASQMNDLLKSVLPMIIRQQGIMPFSLLSPGVFSDIHPVLMQILTQPANQSSWDRLEGMLGDLLSSLRDTPVWDSVPPAVSVMRQVTETLVNNMQAETEFIFSFQKPLTALMTELPQVVNASHFNIANVSVRMPQAIQLTVEAAMQAANESKTLECRQVLKAWEPVREAAGLSESSLALWCNISLLPVMEAYATSHYIYTSLNMTVMGNGTESVKTTAAEIVAALRSFYWVQVNHTTVSKQLGEALYDTFFQLNMTTEDQADWNARFLQLQLSQSTQGLRMALEQLDGLALDNPLVRSYLLAVEMTLNYTVEKSYLLQNSTSVQVVLMDALEILLTGMNFTQNQGLWMRPYLQAVDMVMNYTVDYEQLLQNRSTAQHLLMEALEMILTSTNLTQDSIQAILTGLNFNQDLGVWIRPYLQAMEMAMNYTVDYSQLLQNHNSAQQLLMEALEMILTSTNLTQDSIQAILTGLNFNQDLGVWIRPYLQAMEMAMNYTVDYSQLLQNHTSAQQLLMEALEMILTSTNLTQDSIQAILTGLNVNQDLEVWIRPYLQAMEMAMNYTVDYSQLLQNHNSAQQLLMEALEMILTSTNLTQDSIHAILTGMNFNQDHGVWIRPYLQAMEMAMNYTVDYSQLLQNHTSAQQLLMEALEMILTNTNLTQDSIQSILTGMNFNQDQDLWMRLYLQSMDMVMNYTMDYKQLLQNPLYTQQLLMEALEMILTNTNLTQDSIQAIITGMNFTQDQDLWMPLFLQSVEIVMNYTMNYSELLQNDSYTKQLLMEALEMILTSTNLTQDSIQAILTGDIFSRPDRGLINKLLKDIVRELVRVQLLGDWPMVYGFMEQLLSDDAPMLILEKAIEFSSWWGSTNATGFDVVTQALPRIYEMVKAFISSVHLPPISEMFVEIAENVISVLRQLSQTSDLFSPLDYYLRQLHDEMTGRSKTPFLDHQEGVSRRVRRELTREVPLREPMDDFLDLFYLDYSVLFRALAIPPTMPDIMEIAHMFFANADLSAVLKGFSRDMIMVPPSTGNISMSSAGALTWGPAVPSVQTPLDEPIDVALGILSYLTLPSQWKTYGQLFMEIAHEDWSIMDLGELQRLSSGLGDIVELAIVLSQQPLLEVTHRVERIVRRLGTEVAGIVYSSPNNGSNRSIQFLTALNNIVADNLEEASEFTSQFKATIHNILNSVSRPGAYISLDPYMMALEQTVGALDSYLSTDSLMYLNTSSQMVKGFALLVAHPQDLVKMTKAVGIISDSLDHFLAFVGDTNLPDGRSIQIIIHPLLLNSALSTYTLFNITNTTHFFSSPQEKEAVINQTFRALVDFLPEDQRIYTLPLEPALLTALSGVSNTTQIPSAFPRISEEVIRSILTMLNLTNTQAGFQGANTSAMTEALVEVSQQVSNSIWQGFSTPPSARCVPSLLSLNQAVMALVSLVPKGSEENLNISLRVLHITTTAINYTATTGDIAGATAVISSSVQRLLASLSSYPSLQTTGSIIADLEQTIQKMLAVLQSGRSYVSRTADVTQLLFHNVQGLLGLANNSNETSLAHLVLDAAKLNMENLLTMNETNWTHRLSMVLTDVAKNVTRIAQNASAHHKTKRDLGAQLSDLKRLNSSLTKEHLNRLTSVLTDIANGIPVDLPYALLIKNITMGLANESQQNLYLMLQTVRLGSKLLNSSWSDETFGSKLGQLTSKVCTLEQMDSNKQLMLALSLDSGFLCKTFMPTIQALRVMAKSVLKDNTDLYNVLFDTFVGDPNTYNINTNWTDTFTEIFGLNFSSLSTLNIKMTLPGVVKVSELLRNKTAFALEVQRFTDITPEILHLMMETVIPNSNLQILAWLTSMRHCKDPTSLQMNSTEQLLFQVFCHLPVNQWYNFLIIVARYTHLESVAFKLMLSSEMQGTVGLLLQMVKFLTDMMGKMLPAISHLQDHLLSIRDLNLVSDPEFQQMVHGQTSSMSSKATFITVTRALCSHGIMSLFGISKLPNMMGSDPSTQREHRMDELIDKFKIPRNATPFCMNLYLDMVNTTGGAIAWAFLKPMLLGQVLYSPDTPLTRAIMEKSNATLQQFASLKMYSQDWLQSSSYVMESAKILTKTLPMLQNSLANSFVQNFIAMQTGIDVGQMKDTLKNFSNMTTLLEKNKNIVTQITTLSNLMMNLSSCINFDRFHGLNSTDELNARAEHLTQTRDLYASILFKLPKDNDDESSRKRRDAPGSSSSTLPPKVDYTIRMSIENSMRTDRTRNPFWIKDPYISSMNTLRYNRGFVYLQESIDRAIIETQTGQQVTEPAVQVQAFPYPCYMKDEYLNSISFVFPLALMVAWVLFIANFVKKLVHERELRLHEYMKMMGVNPMSHFFAWFIESACFLIVTIIILTFILKAGQILPKSDGFLLFLYLSDYGLSILAISFLVSSFFDQTNIAGLSGSLIYLISFFPFIIVMSMENSLSFFTKSALSLFAPTCFSYASQYISRYEIQGEGIQWSNQYTSPLADDKSSFGWLCWLLLIDSLCYFIIGAYIRLVFPGKYGIAKPWYFPVMPSFWTGMFCCCSESPKKVNRGLLFANILKSNISVFPDEMNDKAKDSSPSHMEEEVSGLPVGVALYGLTKTYGDRAAIENLSVKFYEGQVTALLGHNGAGKTTTMSLLTGLFAPSSGTIEVYGKDMGRNIDDVRQELGVCMQYDVHFDHMTAKEHLLLYGQMKAPHWSPRELQDQVRKILEETGMYSHRHKRVGTLSGGMKRKLSISIAFIGGSRLVVLDEPTTGVDPCSRRSIWDIIIQHKKHRTIILSTHHLDEAEVLSDRIAFLERGGLKCCGSPFYLKDKLARGYNLTLTKKVHAPHSGERFDSAEVKAFIQSYMPDARLKEGDIGDQVYSLPPFSSSNAESYRSLLSSLDSNLERLQLGCYGISDTTLEEVFLQLTQDDTEAAEDKPYSVCGSTSDLSASRDSLPEDLQSNSSFGDKASLTGSSEVHGLALIWRQMVAMLIKRVHHSRRDWKGLLSQVVLPVLFVFMAMGLGSIRSDLQNFPEMELSPALYNKGPQYSFFSNQNANSSNLVNTMMSFPGIDNGCLTNPDKPVCTRNTNSDSWETKGDSSVPFKSCNCTSNEQVCVNNQYQPPHKTNPSSQIVYNLTGINVENYLVSTANNYIRNRYGGFDFGDPLPTSLQMDLLDVPMNRTLSKVWYNPEGHHTMPAYLNSLNNFILRTSLSAGKDPKKYGISVSSHPYPGEVQEEDAIVQGVVHILVALCVLTGYSIMTASFVIYEVQEHHSGSKRLQHISGIGEPFYWAINFFYDMAFYMIPVALSVATVAAFQIPFLTDKQNLAAVSLLLVMFGFATFPWMYLLSGIFKDAEMAFISYVCINLFITINTIISTSIMYFLGQLNENNESIHEVYRILCYVFLIFPQFSFGNGLMELARVDMQVQILDVYGIDAYKNPFAMDMLGWMFISLFLQGFICFTLRLLLNKWLMRKARSLFFQRKAVSETVTMDEDEDVEAERRRMTSGAAVTDLLQVNQLTKVYQHMSKKIQAVKSLSVGIPAGECFGLLGVNGAGKTTTFKMLTGDISPTDGTAKIKDWDGRMVDIINCRNEGINIGYCPQVDALDGLLTGEEHLYFYARIRGIANRDMDQVVSYLLKKLELGYHRHTITDSYSCGTRRKLSTALALIGHPHILLLDEPSSGMDPRSKRHLWKIISEEVKGKCAVVLTSHSMEECEALCTRLAIMVKGQFRCLGSLQHIKNRFGSGFTVKMYLAVSSCDVEVITNFMQHHFPSTYLKDQHSSMVEYHVPVAPGGVADIFDQLESNKVPLQIKHFSVSQTTLDEVFINFAMGKGGMEIIPIHSEEGSEADSISLESIGASDT
ncbi:uncharacterized protein abca12 isoform X2 [Esox lucius]|nr:uncharacterized protein abca12 isoform X2 [Esox lucius]